jgi:hypothetical protein
MIMFDTPDLMPCCLAPFMAFIVGFTVYGLGSGVDLIIEKRTGKKSAWFHSFILLLVFILVPTSCIASVALDIGVRDPAPWFTPTSKDVIGKWELAADDIDYLQKYNNIPVLANELVFNQDGTFYITNIPTFWGLWDSKNKKWVAKYIFGSGTWRLGQIEGTERQEWILFAQFHEANNLPENRIIRFYFQGHLPPYRLAALDGDFGFHFHKKR